MNTDFLSMSNFGILVTIIAIALLVWECLAFIFKKRSALISTWMQKIGFKSPAVALFVGMILGHVWMYFPPTIDNEKIICPNCKAELNLKTDEVGNLTADIRVTQ